MRPSICDRLCGRFGVAVVCVVLAWPLASSARVYTLDECIATALANNTALASAQAGLDGARADVMSSWSGVLPRVSAGLSESDQLVVAEGIETSSTGVNGNVSLSQVLFDGSTFASISGSQHSRAASEASLEATRRSVVLGARQGYYGLLKAVQLRDVAAEAVDLAREQLRKTQSLFDLGSASRSDLLKAEVQVAQQELNLITAEKNAATARAGLCYAIGIDVTTELEAVDPAPEQAEEAVLDFDLDEAVARRPDIRSQEEMLVAAQRSLLAAKAAWWPDLSLSISYGRYKESMDDFWDDLSDDYSRAVTLNLSVPIFDGLATVAGVSRANANLRSYELALKDARLAAAYEIETARLSVQEQRSRVATAEKALANAEEDLRVSEERFRLRSASMLELIDARTAYSRSKAELVQARYDHEAAKAELKTALGL